MCILCRILITKINQSLAMDNQVFQIKTEPQVSEEYFHQYETNSEQSQNNGVFSPNPIPSPNLKQCEKCGFISNSMNQIAEHISNCNQSTTSLSNITNDHDYNILLDDEIIKTETQILDLNSYEVTISQEFNFDSLSAENTWKSNDDEKSKEYNCTTCKKSFSNCGYLQEHYKTILHKKAVKKSGLPDPANLPDGTQICVNTPIPLQYPTEDVEGFVAKRIHSKEYLNQYICIRTKENLYKCDQCSKEFGLKSKLRLHMYTHTGERPVSCNLCGKGFLTTGRLNTHKTVHSTEKEYKCNQCPKQFNRKSYLTVHMFTHTRKRPFSCNLCGKGFVTNAHLNTHKTIHSTEKEYKCDQCPKQFKRKSCLTVHMFRHINKHKIIHNTEKRYKCDQCPKQFDQKCYLNVHMFTHTGERPFSCNLCGKGFVTNSRMNRHKATHSTEKRH